MYVCVAYLLILYTLLIISHKVKKTEVELLLLGSKLSNCTIFSTSSTILTAKASTKPKPNNKN